MFVTSQLPCHPPFKQTSAVLLLVELLNSGVRSEDEENYVLAFNKLTAFGRKRTYLTN
jgi:hypothetical protein